MMPEKTSNTTNEIIANISFIECLTIKPTSNPMIKGTITGMIHAISGGVAKFQSPFQTIITKLVDSSKLLLSM